MPPLLEGTVRLSDGRALTYAEWGDPAGTPVLHFHGIPGSRLERATDERMYARLGVRYITVDRPGYGRSEESPGRTFVDWGADVAELIGVLGIERFRAFAVSGGAPFALAVAAVFPENVERVSIVSGVGPVDRPGAFRGMEWSERATYWAAPRYPRATAAISGAALSGAVRASDALARAASHAGKTVGARAMGARALTEQFRESLRQGAGAMVLEDALCAQPWGFELASVSCDVQLWHGDRDHVCPLHHARFVASALPHAQLTVRRAGHLLVLRVAEEALRELIA